MDSAEFEVHQTSDLVTSSWAAVVQTFGEEEEATWLEWQPEGWAYWAGKPRGAGIPGKDLGARETLQEILQQEQQAQGQTTDPS